MSIEVVKGVPLPDGTRSLPFDTLREIEDSFFVPGKPATSLANAIQAAQRKYKFKLLSRTVIEQGQMGTRIWLLHGPLG